MPKQTVREFVTRIEKGLLDTSSGGILSTRQQEKFIGKMVDAWSVLSKVRLINNMDSPNYELNELDIADRQAYKPTAGTEPTSGEILDFTINSRTLTVEELSLAANISKNWLMRNIEKESAEQTINNKLGISLGGNILDLAINGDGTTSGFLAMNKGWLTLADEDSTVNDFDTDGSQDMAGVVFPGLRDALPEKARFTETEKPVIVCNIADADTYLDQIKDRKTARGDQALIDGIAGHYEGHPIVPFPYWPKGHFFMTPLSNLVIGIWEKMALYRQYMPRKHQLEFTLDAQVDPNYELGWMIAYGRNTA